MNRNSKFQGVAGERRGWEEGVGVGEGAGVRGADGGTPPRPRNNNSGDNVSRQIAQSVNQHKHR